MASCTPPTTFEMISGRKSHHKIKELEREGIWVSHNCSLKDNFRFMQKQVESLNSTLKMCENYDVNTKTHIIDSVDFWKHEIESSWWPNFAISYFLRPKLDHLIENFQRTRSLWDNMKIKKYKIYSRHNNITEAAGFIELHNLADVHSEISKIHDEIPNLNLRSGIRVRDNLNRAANYIHDLKQRINFQIEKMELDVEEIESALKSPDLKTNDLRILKFWVIRKRGNYLQRVEKLEAKHKEYWFVRDLMARKEDTIIPSSYIWNDLVSLAEKKVYLDALGFGLNYFFKKGGDKNYERNNSKIF